MLKISDMNFDGMESWEIEEKGASDYNGGTPMNTYTRSDYNRLDREVNVDWPDWSEYRSYVAGWNDAWADSEAVLDY